jgi:TonB family protein
MWQSTLCLGACWLIYWLALRRETCFHYNRQFLRFTPLLAMLLPLLLAVAAPGWLSSWLSSGTEPTALVTPSVMLPTATATNETSPPTLWTWLPLLYGAGVLLGLARLGWQLLALWLHIRHLPRQKHSGYSLIETNGKLPTSSFGRLVLWDETADLTSTEARQVLYHELVHVQQGHTWERLYLEMLRSVLWFNPFVHLYPRALVLTHEYLADAAVLAAAPTPDAPVTYVALLARLALRRLYPQVPLAHCFTYSPILTRIAMLQSTTPVRRWKQWLLLPVSAVLLVTIACEQVVVREKPVATNVAESEPAPAPPTIDTQVDAPPPTPGIRNLLDTKVYQYVDKMPRYPGGPEQLLLDMQKQLQYPAAAKAAKLQGKVFVEFVVAEDGSLRDVELKKGISAPVGLEAVARQMDEAAVAAVQTLPGKWTPGKQSGNPVPVSFTIPVSFVIN